MTPFTVSNHSLSIILGCQRAGFYYKVKGRVKVTEVKPGADAGSVLHTAFASYYGSDATLASVLACCQPLLEHNAGEDYRTPAYLADCLRAYERHWGDDRTTFKTVAVELPFQMQLSDWLTFEGRVDRVYKHPDGRLVVQDHKSGKQYGNADLDRFSRNPALPGYALAVSRLLGKPVVTAELNSITMRAPLVKERSDSKPRYEFHRPQFTIDAEVQEEWRINTLRVVTAFLQAVETDTVTYNANSCVSAFGRCPWFDVCEQSPNARETLLQSDMYRPYQARVAATD